MAIGEGYNGYTYNFEDGYNGESRLNFGGGREVTPMCTILG
jgi:hypothetical protein